MFLKSFFLPVRRNKPREASGNLRTERSNKEKAMKSSKKKAAKANTLRPTVAQKVPQEELIRRVYAEIDARPSRSHIYSLVREASHP